MIALARLLPRRSRILEYCIPSYKTSDSRFRFEILLVAGRK